MLDNLRTPFFVAALLLIVAVFLVEIGATAFLGAESLPEYDKLPKPGLAIPYLALIDGLIVFTVGLMGMPLLLPERVHGRIQGVITFIVAILVLFASIVLIFTAIGLLMLMVSLFMAVPFGTLVYMGVYGEFDLAGSRATLGTLMTFKLAFAACLLLAHQRFLENKGLVLIILTSLLANIVTAFLHGLVPRFLVSITDDIAAIVVAILAALWALSFLIGSIPAIVKALRVDRALA
jgi:hypothetical protein